MDYQESSEEDNIQGGGASARCKLATQCGTSQQIRNLSSSGKEREKGDDPRKSRTPFDPVIMQKSSHTRKAGALPSEGKESQPLSRIGGHYRREERWCRSVLCLSLSRSLRRLLEVPLGFV